MLRNHRDFQTNTESRRVSNSENTWTGIRRELKRGHPLLCENPWRGKIPDCTKHMGDASERQNTALSAEHDKSTIRKKPVQHTNWNKTEYPKPSKFFQIQHWDPQRLNQRNKKTCGNPNFSECAPSSPIRLWALAARAASVEIWSGEHGWKFKPHQPAPFEYSNNTFDWKRITS